MKILFISYNGALDSLGQSQVLPYLLEILKGGHEVRLLTFERRSPQAARNAAALRIFLERKGIHWTWLWYNKKPPVLSTIWDVARGIVVACWITLRHRVQVVHGRSQVSSAMAWPAARLFKRRFVFDLRGQMAYEYADGGIWPEGGLLYRLVERAERRFTREADVVVVLTHKLADDIRPIVARPPFVIPTCVDLNVFKKEASVLPERPSRMVYCGSLGARYSPVVLVDFYQEAAKILPDLDLFVLTHSPMAILEPHLAAAGVPSQRYRMLKVEYPEVPKYLAQGLFGVFLLVGSRSLRGACPTKIGEYLAAGLPVISSPHIGDLDDLIEGERVGVVLRGHDRDALREGAVRLATLLREGQALRDRCQKVAEREYSLTGRGGPSYRALYRDLGSAR